MARQFVAAPAVLGEVPMLIGLAGPPGGGKTMSALRLARGMQRVRPGPIVLIDTESGRARKYSPEFEFQTVRFVPPFRPSDFLEAIEQQLKIKPAAIIVDSLSDEHEGDGGVLDWHDANVGSVGGNEWAAWARPKADRRKLISGILQITTPLIFTFRAREKTKQVRNDRGKNEPTNIGFMPIAPPEIVHALDLVCLLPPRAEGVPVWSSDKAGEDFTIKLPEFLKPFIQEGRALDEAMGEAFARWAMGDSAPASKRETTSDKPDARPTRTLADRVDEVIGRFARVATVEKLHEAWVGQFMTTLRDDLAAQDAIDLLDRLEIARSRREQDLMVDA